MPKHEKKRMAQMGDLAKKLGVKTTKCPTGQIFDSKTLKCVRYKSAMGGIDTQTRATRLKPMLADIQKRRKEKFQQSLDKSKRRG